MGNDKNKQEGTSDYFGREFADDGEGQGAAAAPSTADDAVHEDEELGGDEPTPTSGSEGKEGEAVDEDAALLQEFGLKEAPPETIAALKATKTAAAEATKRAENMENEARRRGSQNEQLSKQLKQLRKQFADDPVMAREAFDAVLKKADLSKLTPGARELVESPDFAEATRQVFRVMREMHGEDAAAGIIPQHMPGEGPAEGGTDDLPPDAPSKADFSSWTPEQKKEYEDKLIDFYQGVSESIKNQGGYKDFEKIYGSEEFRGFMESTVTREVEINRGLFPGVTNLRILSPTFNAWVTPNAAGHIDLLQRFDGYKAAKEADKQRRRQGSEIDRALDGVGRRGGGSGPGQGGGKKGYLDMTDAEFEAEERKWKSGMVST